MDCSDCDSSALDSPNSSWSIARLKEYLRGKKRPSKRGKAEPLERDYLHRHRHLDSLFVFFFFFFFFFSCFFFFSLPLLLVMPHTSHLQERSPTSIALLFLQLEYVAEVWSLLECTLRVGQHHRVKLAARSAADPSPAKFTSLALQPLAFRHLSTESGFISWPTVVNCTLSLRAVPFSASSHGSQPALIPLETGARRLAGAKKKTPMALHLLPGSDQLSLLCHDR